MAVAEGFSYVVDDKTQLVVLGSMPGLKSLDAQAYYAHPRNLFWPFMQALFAIDEEASYDARLQCLLGAGIGLWDVYHQCERQGSLDSAIQQHTAKVNDFTGLFDRFPLIHTLAFNGQTAHKAFLKYVAADADLQRYLKGKKLLSLPSTSPANAAIPYAKKWQSWQAINTMHTVKRAVSLYSTSRKPMVLNKKAAVSYITENIESIYSSLSEGEPVSLSKRFHLEGQINLMITYEVIEFSWLKSFINCEYEKWMGESVSSVMWQWMRDDGCFYLPIKMHEAPVYKTTS